MNKTPIIPYLNFGGRCEEAIAFYKKTLGAEVEMLMRFSESPEPMPAGILKPGFENKVMHTSFRIRGNTIMASDGCGDASNFSGFSLSLTAETETEANQLFASLVENGEVLMPLQKTFYSPRFGMLKDRFGMHWMIIVPAPMPK